MGDKERRVVSAEGAEKIKHDRVREERDGRVVTVRNVVGAIVVSAFVDAFVGVFVFVTSGVN